MVTENGQLKCGVSHHLTSWAMAEVGEHLWELSDPWSRWWKKYIFGLDYRYEDMSVFYI